MNKTIQLLAIIIFFLSCETDSAITSTTGPSTPTTVITTPTTVIATPTTVITTPTTVITTPTTVVTTPTTVVTTPTNCKDTNCANYTSQAAAQAAYKADPTCRADLDADKDGIACEEPGNSVKTCATTSNCGCSNKNKSVCESDICCRWIVGTGCKCR